MNHTLAYIAVIASFKASTSQENDRYYDSGHIRRSFSASFVGAVAFIVYRSTTPKPKKQENEG